MKYLFVLCAALLRGAIAFCAIVVLGGLWLMSATAEERAALAIRPAEAQDHRVDLAVLRMARAMLALAPETSVRALSYMAPPEVSRAEIGAALAAIASGEAARALHEAEPIDRPPSPEPSPPATRIDIGARFLRAPT